MAKLPTRNELKVWFVVRIETKKDQGTNRLTSGTIAEILTTSKYHPHGIKVRLQDGQVGRVKKVDDATRADASVYRHKSRSKD